MRRSVEASGSPVSQPHYTRVIVPEVVVQELKDPVAPAAVRACLEMLPDSPFDPTLRSLDAGESAALTLAQLLNADELLIDDLAGRAEAERRRLRVTGTLGVLADAHLAGLLDFDQAVALLHSTNFRIYPDVERLVRRRIAAEKRGHDRVRGSLQETSRSGMAEHELRTSFIGWRGRSLEQRSVDIASDYRKPRRP